MAWLDAPTMTANHGFKQYQGNSIAPLSGKGPTRYIYTPIGVPLNWESAAAGLKAIEEDEKKGGFR